MKRHHLANIATVKAKVFPAVVYKCENWTTKKAEHQRIEAFELWCWRRLLRVTWTSRWSSQSLLKEINPEYSIEGLMLKLKPQYFGHLMWSANSLEDSDSGKDWRQEEKGMTEGKMVGWHHRLNGHEFDQALGDGKDREAWHAAVHRVAESDKTEWLNNNNELIKFLVQPE